jgi:two-component system KDP operon response regulator KdpE
MAARVLVVDDDPDLRLVLSHLLRRQGYATSEAASAGEALDAIVNEPPQLVLLDLGLPQGGGLAVLRQLREWGASIPVLVITGATDDTEVALALDLGASRCLFKPFVNSELLVAISMLLGPDAQSDEA